MWSFNHSGTVAEVTKALDNIEAVLSGLKARDQFVAVAPFIRSIIEGYQGTDIIISANGDSSGIQITVEVI